MQEDVATKANGISVETDCAYIIHFICLKEFGFVKFGVSGVYSVSQIQTLTLIFPRIVLPRPGSVVRPPN